MAQFTQFASTQHRLARVACTAARGHSANVYKWVLLWALVLGLPNCTLAQPDTSVDTDALPAINVLPDDLVEAAGAASEGADGPRPGFVRLNLQGNIKLQALIDLVGKRIGWNFLYDSKIAERQINVKAPNDVPADALPTLLSSVLRMENLAIVDADVPGWKRIIDAGSMIGQARPGNAQEELERNGAATPVTQAFVVKHVDVQQLATIIRPFLTKTGSNVLPIPASRVLVITDFAPVVLTAERLIKLLDQPPGEAEYEVYTVKNVTSGKLAEQVGAMLSGGTADAPTIGGTLPGGVVAPSVGLFDEPRTNQIVVVGTRSLVDKALELLEKFDVSLGLTTKVYRLQYVKAQRIDKIVQGFLAPRDTDRAYKSTIDEEGNLLIVRATPEIHARIDELKGQMDVPIKGEESPIRFYKLKNANATDVLYTLLALQEAGGTGGVLGFGGETSSPYSGPLPGTAAGATPGGAGPLSINITSAQPQTQGFASYGQLGQRGASPFAGQQYGTGAFGGYGATNQPLRLPLSPQHDATASYGNIQQFQRDRQSAVLAPQLATGGVATLPGGARVSADITTNSLVIVARTEVQALYARLIEALDVRRPQVLVEAKIVAIDTSGDFRLGVEFSGGDRVGAKRLFSFTSFGLSEVDATSGALSIIPSLGFNGTLVDPDVADVVVKALSSNSRVNVLASPRILVNDNATGQLESVTSIPFESVNASDTVATTSLGGDQQAGTSITVTPHIKEGGHLQLEFSLEFSTFAEGGGATTLPPPRQIDRVGSAITVPSGHTVIVGGLQRDGDTNIRTGLPYAEAIPILRELTSLTTRRKTTTSFFVFIRPLILRDGGFEDLKFLSDASARNAGLPPEYPTSQPVMIE